MTTRLASSLLLATLGALPACSRDHTHHSQTEDAKGSDAGPELGGDAAIEEDAAVAAAPISDVYWTFADFGDHLRIIGVHLAEGTLDALSYDMPHATSTVSYAEAWRDEIVRFELKDGSTTVEASGTPWQTIDTAPAGHQLYTTVDDSRTLVWTEDSLRADYSMVRSQLALVTKQHDGDGSAVAVTQAPLFTWNVSTATGKMAPRWHAYGKNTAFFMQDGQLFGVRAEAGATATLLGAIGADANLKSVFDTSLIVATDDQHVAWIDAQGAHITPPGFASKPYDVMGEFQLDGQKLSLLRDGEVKFAQQLPTGHNIENIVAARYPAGRPLAVLGKDDRALSFVGGEGKVLASYQAYKSPMCTEKMALDNVTLLGMTPVENDQITALIVIEHWCAGEEEVLFVGNDLDAYHFDARTQQGITTHLLSQLPDNASPFALSDSGRFAIATVDGNLLRIDTRTAEAVTLQLGGKLLFWTVNW